MEISARTWNPELGLNLSFRPRFFNFDLSTSYTLDDIASKAVQDRGDIYSASTAFSAIVQLNERGTTVLAPVVELNYQRSGMNSADANPAELLLVSPGLSLIVSSLALEALVQLPVYQSLVAGGMEHNMRFITGIKYMF